MQPLQLNQLHFLYIHRNQDIVNLRNIKKYVPKTENIAAETNKKNASISLW